MKRKIFSLIVILLACLGTAHAEPAQDFHWPESFTRVTVNGVDVDCEWRDGQPWALGSDLAPLTKTILPERSINLAEFLAKQGYEIKTSDGFIAARDPNRSDGKSSGGRGASRGVASTRRSSSKSSKPRRALSRKTRPGADPSSF